MQNKYHTQASIGIDKLGHIHVAYNMHNTPWQYSISEYSENIESFIFFGQEVSMAQKLKNSVRDNILKNYNSFFRHEMIR